MTSIYKAPSATNLAVRSKRKAPIGVPDRVSGALVPQKTEGVYTIEESTISRDSPEVVRSRSRLVISDEDQTLPCRPEEQKSMSKTAKGEMAMPVGKVISGCLTDLPLDAERKELSESGEKMVEGRQEACQMYETGDRDGWELGGP